MDWAQPGAQRVKGQTTLKLDRLAPASGFNAHNAHYALGDVEATIHIARRIAGGDPALWSAILHNRDKQNGMATLETDHCCLTRDPRGTLKKLTLLNVPNSLIAKAETSLEHQV